MGGEAIGHGKIPYCILGLERETLVPAGGLQGWSPTPGSLLQTPDGNLYGSTESGGAFGVFGGGTIFKISPGGKFTTIYNLCSLANCADGSFGANFVLATDGNFYGTTQYGGDLSCNDRLGCGTIFMMTPTGGLTTLHTFAGPDGGTPEGLVHQAYNRRQWYDGLRQNGIQIALRGHPPFANCRNPHKAQNPSMSA